LSVAPAARGAVWKASTDAAAAEAERQVDMLGGLVGEERERPLAVAERHSLGRLVADPDADDVGDGEIEVFRRGEVARAEPEMVHAADRRLVAHRLDAVAVEIVAFVEPP
jgi:hypothetical protein